MSLLDPTLDTTPKRRRTGSQRREPTVADVHALDLRVAGLLAALPPLTGADAEVVAIGTVMRTRAVGEVLARVLDTHARPTFTGSDATDEDNEAATRNLLKVWREHIAAIAAQTDAEWWATHGTRGVAAVTHPPTPKPRRTR